jgi:hypothetical protein
MFKTARLNSLVLLLSQLRQSIGRGSQIVAQHGASGDDLVLDCLLNQFVLADPQPRGNLGSQRTKSLVTPTQRKDSSRSHVSSITPNQVMSRGKHDIIESSIGKAIQPRAGEP